MPEVIDGNTLTATVVDLNAWVEYEFRVLAKNGVGVGEPSPVSVRTRTEDAGPAWLTSSILIAKSCHFEKFSHAFSLFSFFLSLTINFILHFAKVHIKTPEKISQDFFAFASC